MKTLIILNDPPYGTERSYNGLRLANSLAGAEATVRVFLLGDAAGCAKPAPGMAPLFGGVPRRGFAVFLPVRGSVQVFHEMGRPLCKGRKQARLTRGEAAEQEGGYETDSDVSATEHELPRTCEH